MAPPKPKKRTFEGQVQADRLAKWLNQRLPDGVPNPEQIRVGNLIHEIKNFLDLTKQIRQEKGILPFKNDSQNPRAAGDDLKEATEELQERLLRYWRSTQLIVTWPPAARAKIVDVNFQITWMKGSEVSQPETDGFLDVLSLTRSGNLHRLQECPNCSRWMFVKFPHGDRSQKQCSDESCKRETRAYYMRDYQRKRREREKKADEKAKATIGYGRKR